MQRDGTLAGGEGPVMRRVLPVRSVQGDMLQIEVEPISACSQCQARSACGTGALAEMLSTGKQTLLLPNTVDAKPGDQVVVTAPASEFLAAAALAYLLPVLALILVAGAASLAGLPDLVTVLLCLPTLALALQPLRRKERSGDGLSGLKIEQRLPAALS